MPRKSSDHPTPFELELLDVLWESAPATAREVRKAMAERGRDLAHTSLITTLNLMHEKGYLRREKASEGKSYCFFPRVSRDDVSRGMVGDLVERVFKGSASALILNLLESDRLDAAEHAELRRALARKRDKSNNGKDAQ